MTLTDTHIHLYAAELAPDFDMLMKQAADAGVKRFFLPNIDEGSVTALMALAEKYSSSCFAMMGLHPCSVNADYKAALAAVESTLSKEHENIYAIGETGIDLFWDKTFVNEQEEAFITQCEWSHNLKLPIVIHSRNSIEEIIELIKKQRALTLKGIFHCFSGNTEQAHKIIELGFYLGIGGVVTFKNSGLDKVVEQVDLKHIVLETDAPYLAPAPHRGKRNIPAYLKLIADKVAAIKNIPVEEVASITTENSKQIFKV